jgi:hypothetical protein
MSPVKKGGGCSNTTPPYIFSDILERLSDLRSDIGSFLNFQGGSLMSNMGRFKRSNNYSLFLIVDG